MAPLLPVEEVRGNYAILPWGEWTGGGDFSKVGLRDVGGEWLTQDQLERDFDFTQLEPVVLGEVLSSEANTPCCWPAGRSQMKATINGRRTFTFCESFLFVWFCSNRQCLKRNRLI